MSERVKRPAWDYNIGLVLVLVGAFIILVKFKILQFVLSLWPLALIFLGWQMYRKADDRPRRRHRASAPPPPLDEDDLD